MTKSFINEVLKDYESPVLNVYGFSAEIGFAQSPADNWSNGTLDDVWNNMGIY